VRAEPASLVFAAGTVAGVGDRRAACLADPMSRL